MAEESLQDRTEKATPRRREKAREEGRVARSNELNSAVILMLGLTTIYLLGPLLGDQIKQFMVYIFSEAPNIQCDMDSIIKFMTSNIINFFLLLGPILAVLAIIAYGINVLQVGFMVTGKPMEPKFDKLNPINGLKKLISVKSLVELTRDVLKLILIGVVAYLSISSNLNEFYKLSDSTVGMFAGTMSAMALKTALQIGVVILILAFLDYAFQKYDFEKQIKMSKQDIREESKETEGSPETRSRIRQAQREMVRRRMMQEIPKADVVITNPTHIAIAIKYDQNNMDAPTVVAKGERLIAEKIKEVARAAGVPIVENKPLARALFSLCDIGSTIPGKLYKAVAEVLAYVYRLKGEKV
ncbi:MAG: flagellar biosynthesis protein FlhB [Candidatus Zixiibacteriota bacterium]